MRASFYIQLVRSDGCGDKQTITKKLRTHGDARALHKFPDRVSHELFEELNRELTPSAIDHLIALLQEKVPCTEV